MTRTLRAIDGDAAGPDVPSSIPAEQAVLGAAMLSPAAFAEARAILDGSEFYRPAHQVIWEAITALADRGDPHDPLSVGAYLGPAGLSRTGGAPYLHTLLTAVPVAASGAYYAHIVRDLAYARQVLEASHRLAQSAWQAAGDADGDLRGTVATEFTALAEASRRGWPDPLPLSSAALPPPFPLWTLPGWLGEYAASVAEVTQTPPDLAAMLALAVTATAAGGKIWLQPSPDWTEPACLYVVVALPPGERKSAVFRAMTAPVLTAEKQLIARARPLIAEAAVRHRIAEADAERAVKAAEKAAASPASAPGGLDAAVVDAIEARAEFDAAEIPAEPCLFGDDTTIEQLGTMIAEQGGRFAVLSPEGEIFAIAAGRYSGTPNIGVLKSGHAGEAVRVNRRGRAEHLDTATLTLGIATQPGVLARLGDTPQFAEQGLLARILYAVPESMVGRRNPLPAPVPEQVRDFYNATMTALALSLYDLPEPRVIGFDPAAAQAVTSLLTSTENRLSTEKGGDLAQMKDWGGKLAGAIVRIAGLLHVAAHARDGWDRPITLATLEAATEIGEYAAAHAKAAYDLIGTDPATANAHAALDWLRLNRPSTVTNRELMRGLPNKFKKTADLTPALEILESRGWIRLRPAPPKSGRGRTVSTTWEVHPDVWNPP
jgi:replicative DNA helicase